MLRLRALHSARTVSTAESSRSMLTIIYILDVGALYIELSDNYGAICCAILRSAVRYNKEI